MLRPSQLHVLFESWGMCRENKLQTTLTRAKKTLIREVGEQEASTIMQDFSGDEALQTYILEIGSVRQAVEDLKKRKHM